MLRSTEISARRRRGSRLLTAALGLGLVASLAPAGTAAAAPATTASTLAPFDAVDQFIGTQLDTTENKSNDAYGNTYPGAAVPFGMVQPSPTTFKTDEPNGLVQEKGGYEYTADKIRGFGMTRYSGTGCHQRFGGFEFPTIPYAGALSDGKLPVSPDADLRSYFLPFKHANEVSEPGFYEVTTDNGVTTRLTATKRTGVSTFDFSKADGSTLILNTSGANNRVFAADLTIDPATRTVSGSMYGADVCDNGNNYRAYFSTTYDQPFASHGTWNGNALTAGSTSVQKGGTETNVDYRSDVGGWLTFADDAKVTAKTGFSYTSVEAAKANAAAETADKSFDQIRAASKVEWEKALGTVDATGGTDEQRIKLYTALYHSLLQPTIGQDADGRYLGYDGKIHQVESGHDFFRRINFAGQGWDMYRSQAQLIAMLFPKVADDINRSIVTLTQQLGKWSPGAARMSGDNYQVILSTLDAFGATDYDRQAALDSMKKTQLLPATDTTRSEGFQYAAAGFIENRKGDNATSRTLEYAIDDFAIAQLAERLGDDETYETFMGRAQNWQNVFDPQTQHIRPRERTGFARGFDLRDRGDQFNQSTGYQYGWMVPHNIGELVKRRGGVAASTRAVDVLMEKLDAGAYTQTGNYLSNEAAFTTPWVYNWLRAPHKTTDVLYRAVDELYDTSPTGLPGNDDEGALSAWYVFANLGIAPMIHGTSNLLVSAPMFDKVTLKSLGSDRTYEINAPGVSEGKRYTTGLKVDGVAQSASFVGEDFGREGGTLDFTMAAKPGTWGTAAGDVPPSYDDGIDAYNNVGTSPNGKARMGSMDLSDWSFSRETLATRGAAPGATIAHPGTGIEFTWPDTKAGEPDNWVPNGQRIALPEKKAGSISFLGLATNGPSSGTAVVEYTDGSTQRVAVTLNDWTGSGNGNTELVTVSGRNNANGTTGTGTFKVFGTRPATLDSSKTVKSVVLPQATYSGVMHIFDVAVTEQEFVDPNAPKGVPDRIILTGPEDPSTSQYVTWRSTSPLPIDGKVEVRTVGGEARTVDAEEKPERTLNGYPSRSHSAKLTGLVPGTAYEYRVGAGSAWSSWATFTTASAEAKPFEFLYFGDAQEGIDSVWHDTTRAARAAAPNAELGVYAGDMTNTSTIEKEWDDWLAGIGDATRTMNALPTPGNHEVGPEPFMEHYLDTFEHDANGPVASDAGVHASTYGEHIASILKDTAYYTDYQGVRFVTLNANRDDICPIITPPGLTSFNCDTGRQVQMSMQAKWLDRVLQANPHRWSVVIAHQPLYSTGVSGNGLRDEANWRQHILPVIETNNVDLVLQGHDHTYGRGHSGSTKTGIDGVTAGPVYVVSNAGQKQYTLPSATDNIWTRNNATAVVRAQDTSTFQKIRVDGDTLKYEAVVTYARSGGSATKAVGDTLDSFTITKRDDGAKWVTEAGVPVPGPEVEPVNAVQPFDGTFDDETFGGVVFDDDFSTDRLSEYTTFGGRTESEAKLSVDTDAGVLKATAEGRRWSNVQVPVEAGESFALIVEPKKFADVTNGENTLFLGPTKDADNRTQSWYHQPGGQGGFENVLNNTRRGLTEGPVGSTQVKWAPGDRFATVLDQGELTSWIEKDGEWKPITSGLARLWVPKGELATWKPTIGLRLDPGTIEVDRVTVLKGGLEVEPVTPAAVTFDDQPGTKSDTYTVPVTEGVEYLVGDEVVEAGTYPGSGTVMVTARASGNAPIAEGATIVWVHTFLTSDVEVPVTPAAVTFDDQPGTKSDTYTVPATAGVEYLVGGKVVEAGTYPGSGTVMVTARASGAAPIAEGATTEWTYTFSTKDVEVPPVDAAVQLGLRATGRTYGRAIPVSGTLAKASGQAVSGRVSIQVDGRPYRTVTATNGRFSVSLARDLRAGNHRVTASYAGAQGLRPATRTVGVRVAKATPKVSLRVSPKKAKSNRTRVTANVTVSLPGSSLKVDGRVRIKVGGKTVTATVRNGKAKVALRPSGKPGRITVRATYVPTGADKTSVKSRSSKAVKLRLTR